MTPVVLSYFTRGTLYEKEAAGLRRSCEKFGLEYCIEGIEPFGKWFEHAAYKAEYLLKKIELLKRPILWVDADAEFVRYPTFFSSLSCDFSLRVFPDLPFHDPSHFLSSTVYFDYNPRVLELLSAWKEECRHQIALCPEDHEVWDQMLLKDVYAKEKEKWKFTPLPDGYAAIFDRPEDINEETVIIQYQASRLYKRFINNNVANLSFFEALSVEELRQLRPRFDFDPLS